jgi:hypothetical protein
METGFYDRNLGVVRDQEVGDATNMFEGMGMRSDPVRKPLRPCRLSVEIIRSAHDSNKYLRVNNFTSKPVTTGTP